jgi:Tol biopolymer transport system component
VADLKAGTIARASVRSDGTVADGTSAVPQVSGNGRYVVFSSSATNLDALIPDTNADSDIFRHDRLTGTTIRVSLDALGAERDGHSISPSVNADGTRIVFDSAAALVSEDTNSHRDVYLRELTTTTPRTVCLSVDDPVMLDADTVGNGASTFPTISSDGRWVCFLSVASDLTAEDGNGIGDLFVRDLSLETTRRVRQGDGALALDADAAPQPGAWVSDGGRYIVFASNASNLVTGDTNGTSDVFVRDRETSRTRRISVKPDGTQNNGTAGVPRISANGSVVVFSAVGDLPGADPVVVHGYAAPVVPASGG